MTEPRDQLSRYISRREARLAAVPGLLNSRGPNPAWYRHAELLVAEDGYGEVEALLGSTVSGDERVMPGLLRYRLADDTDVMATVRTLHGALHLGAQRVSPNHVFLSSPFNHGGPFGPPVPATAATLPPPADRGRLANISVVDTGLWRETALPAAYLKKEEVDYETATDVNGDGILDGEVGHANFIGGIYAANAPHSELRVHKALNSFGVCSETELIAQLARVDDATHIVNLSIGGYTPFNYAPIGLGLALKRLLLGRDRVVVAAAGNNGNGTRSFWPAAFAGTTAPWSGQVVAVAAHNGQQLCDWSNTGSWVTLAAAGADVRSTFIDHPTFPSGWATWNGTSFAAPRVGAAIAERITEQVGPVAALARLRADIAAGGLRIGGYPALP